MVIFFYPTKQETQDQIKNKIGQKIKTSISQMYYNKAKLTGNIKNENFIKMGLAQLNRLTPNHPRLIQIEGNSLIELLNLNELIGISTLEESKIEEIINEINSYV